MTRPAKQNEQLAPLIGAWSLAMVMPGTARPDPLPDVGARATFEWMGAQAFVVGRWTIPVPEAPDGLLVIGWDDVCGGFLQHHFDDRGVARIYEMAFDGRTWKLWRTQPDFSPFEFSQRFTGTFVAGGSRIEATWEISHDHKTWEKDFDMIYTRVS